MERGEKKSRNCGGRGEEMTAAMTERKSWQCHWDMLREGYTSFCTSFSLAFHCSGAHQVPPAAPFLGHSESPCKSKADGAQHKGVCQEGATPSAGEGSVSPAPFQPLSSFLPQQLSEGCLTTMMAAPLTCCKLNLPHGKILDGQV